MYPHRYACAAALGVFCLLTQPTRAETYTAEQISQMALELGAPGLKATFRGKTITVTGYFSYLSDIEHLPNVHVIFEQTPTIGWKVSCGFPRTNTAEYDRFALMKRGAPITATGDFQDAVATFMFFNLEPCEVQ